MSFCCDSVNWSVAVGARVRARGVGKVRGRRSSAAAVAACSI